MTATEEPSTEPAAKAYSLPDGFGADPGAKPVFTVALLAVLAGVFGLEQLGAVGGSGNGVLGPNAPSLVAMGGVFRGAIREQHEFYRLLSGPMMHGDLIHLALNGFSLFLVGAILERFVGRGWTMVLYAVGALGGSFASYWINPATLVSVGASGAIMGLLASALVVAFKLPEEQGRTQLGKPWDKPKKEQCLGFTIDEFARLDLSVMDFTEVYADFMDAAKLPDEVETMTQIQQKI